jgi:acyl-CoA synthetase (AMP-forming)/AMP-acid ligase II
MLYERWRQIAREYPRAIALRELAANRHWSFAQLDAAAQELSIEGPVAFPIANGKADFVIAVLRAWRAKQVVCPLDPGQARPQFSDKVPPGIDHLKLTSATTGGPRLVAFTAAQLMADARNIVLTMELKPAWPNLGVISLAHSYGFSNLVLPLLLHGIPLVLLDNALPAAVRAAALLYPSVTLAAVPAMWRAWHEAGALATNIGRAISAGAPLPLPLEKAVFQASGLKIHNFYGSTECGGIAYDGSVVPRQDAGCVGAPMKNVEVSIASDGCLQVSGEAVSEGYWPDPAAELSEGIFKTSDLAEITDGLIYLRGRASDQINVAGRKIAPETIEAVLLGHPQVQECLVFGVPSGDAGRGEDIVAYVVSRAGATWETLQQFMLAKVPAWQIPREWRFVESLAPNARGKLSRAEWRKLFLGHPSKARRVIPTTRH